MAVTIVRKRSPRAPATSLQEAMDRVSKIYEKDGLHPANVNIVAQHLGYKSADNGAAKQALATLRYYGLVERISDGVLAVSKNFEEFKYAPSEIRRAEILQKWLESPPVFAELLNKFQSRLPSEASIKYELIQKGFSPAAADECLTAFIGSVQYVEQFSESLKQDLNGSEVGSGAAENEAVDVVVVEQVVVSATAKQAEPLLPAKEIIGEGCSDRIPVRLGGGRRAWIEIPTPFYAADKQRLISQIQLLLADDEE